MRDGRLTTHVEGERDTPLFAANDSTFYTPAFRHVQVTFHRGPNGRPAAADISIGGVTHRAVAVDAPR